MNMAVRCREEIFVTGMMGLAFAGSLGTAPTGAGLLLVASTGGMAWYSAVKLVDCSKRGG
jgi:hypothetical protein